MRSSEEIFTLLKKTFYERKYLITLELIREYLLSKDCRITGTLELIRAVSLIKLNKEEGYRYLEKVKNISNIYVGKTLYWHGLYDLAVKYFEEELFNNYNRFTSCYFLGKIYLYKGDYNQALFYFKESWDLTDDEGRKLYLKKIIDDLEDYFAIGKFIKISYEVFKKENIITNKYMVYVKKSSLLNTTIPYLIYKIDKEDAWGFPLINRYIETHLLNKNKNSGGYYKYVSASISKFKLDDIDSVISKVDDDEFRLILNDLYNYYLEHQVVLKKYKREYNDIYQEFLRDKNSLVLKK